MILIIAANCCAHDVESAGKLKLPAVISDNMVLQQQSDVALWGWANPKAVIEITTSWSESKVTAKADVKGKWRTTIATPVAGGPYKISIRVKGADAGIVLQNILIGEVWICSGQSNMEWNFDLGVLNGDQELREANYPQIRLFHTRRDIAVSPNQDCVGRWQECNPNSVRYFSAVAYFFGRNLHKELNVPIGLINSSWGGTVAETWVSEEGLRPLKDFDERLDFLKLTAKNPESADRKNKAVLDRYWDKINSVDPWNQAFKSDYDHSDWPEMAVPGLWNSKSLANFDGVIWFRRDIELPTSWAGQNLVLELGAIDDMDSTWLNGVKVGGYETIGHYLTKRVYTVPASVVRSGKNVLAVRVVDTGGGGGFFSPAEIMRIRPANAPETQAIPLAGNWHYKVGPSTSQMPPLPPINEINQNDPTTLFNGMISPLIPFHIKGAIWYQGESNRMRYMQYQKLFPALIEDWRNQWAIGEFPFYWVQIAPFNYQGDKGEEAELRDSQRLTLKTPATGMAVTMDIATPNNIHPPNKQEVGRRLALWALAKNYKRGNIEYSGPLYREMKVEGSSIRLYFDHAGDGLATGPEGLDHFEIADSSGKFFPAKAVIDNDTLVVSSDKVKSPTAVRYAWGTIDEGTLFNKSGLPASSFSTQNGGASDLH